MRIRRAVGLSVAAGLAGALTGPYEAALATMPAPDAITARPATWHAATGTPAAPQNAIPPANPASPAGVRLATKIAVLDRSTDGANTITRYSVTVGADGGTAHDTELEVTTERPAEWHSYVGACKLLEPSGLRLLCDLGEVTAPASVQMTMAAPGDAVQDPSVVAVAGASNAQSQEFATGATPLVPGRPQKALPAPVPELPPVQTHRAVQRGTRTRQAPRAVARPAPTRAVPPVQAVRPQRPAGRPEPQLPVQPQRPQLPVQPQPFPPAPQLHPFQPLAQQPQQQLGSPMPFAPAAPNTGAGLLPQLTPNGGAPLLAPSSLPPTDPAKLSAANSDTSPLSMTTSAAVPGDRASWVKVLGIIVVAEVAVLWLATSLGLWRRRSEAAALLRASLKAASRKATGFKARRLPPAMIGRSPVIRSRLSFRR